MNHPSAYLAAIGRRGGIKSRRTLDSGTARALVRAAEEAVRFASDRQWSAGNARR